MSRESRVWKDIIEGDELPSCKREITRTAVVAMAFAARDFLPPLHFDHEVAQQAGLKDINVNIIATGGLIEKFLIDWCGPGARLKKLKYNVGMSAYPGDTLVHTGKVVKKYAEGDEYLADMEYSLAVKDGPHAWGTATLVFP